MNEQNIIKRAAYAAGAIVIGLPILWGSWYTVDEGERGVLLRNGGSIGTAEPGLGFKIPFIDGVRKISVQTRARTYENVLTYSRDQQTAALVLSVNYRLPPDQVELIYATYGGEEGIADRLLDRQVLEKVKNVFGQFNAVTAIQDRARLNAQVQEAVQSAVRGPIIVESVQIENIDFSDTYENSIEQRMLAEVEVQKVTQNAARERVQAEIAVIQAQAAADAQIATATAAAETTRLQGEAEAKAIAARGEAEAEVIRAKQAALSASPNVIALTQAERWNGVLPTTMIPGGSVPFLTLK
jgi:regulator of protease activity HflC (stomatin/prohibitin superfamily)